MNIQIQIQIARNNLKIQKEQIQEQILKLTGQKEGIEKGIKELDQLEEFNKENSI